MSRCSRGAGNAPRGEGSSWLRAAIGALLVLADVAAGAVPAAGGINVIANASVSAKELSLATLRSVFLMRTREWPDGTPITVFVLPDRDESHVAFCTKLLKTLPYVLRDTWDRSVFTGTGQGPIEVPSQQELLPSLAERPAVTFLSASTTEY